MNQETSHMTRQNSALVAYCGLYCGDCIIKKGEIADLSKALYGKLQKAHLDRIGPGLAKLLNEFKPLENMELSHSCLKSLSQLRCTRICRQGGGTAACKIRICCQAKHFVGCWECDEFEQCKILSWLEPVNGHAHLKNIRKIKTEGMARFLRGEKYW